MEAPIQDNFDDLAGNVFFIGENSKLNTTINTFPNPVSANLNVDISNFSDFEPITLKLVNVVGSTVYQTQVQSGNNAGVTINTSEIKNGIYILIAESDSKQARQKVLVQH